MELTTEEIRVLGCMIEKERTTPDQYPMTTNALRLACNQKTSREPIVDYTEVTVDQTMLALRQAGLARTVSGSGMRSSKHKHVLGEAWGLSNQELALLSVLMLRGPQTVGELRSRSDRLANFSSLQDVEEVLADLAARQPEALVLKLERQPGQKEERWAHLLAGEVQWPEPSTWTPTPRSSGGGGGSGATSALTQRVAELEEEVGSLRSDLDVLRGQFDALCEQLGVSEPD